MRVNMQAQNSGLITQHITYLKYTFHPLLGDENFKGELCSRMCHYLSVVMFCEYKKLISQQILILSICSSFPLSRRLSLYWNGKFFIHPQCFKENDLSPCLKQHRCKRTQYFLMINQCSLYFRVAYAESLGERNGNPFQYSCLEHPLDRGAWWAAVQRVAQNQTRLKRLSMRAHIGEGNCNPLQYTCLENPRDGGAWWAAVYGVTQSQTWLKLLSSSSIQKVYFIVIMM